MHNTAPSVQNKTTQPWWNNHCCQRSLPIPIASCWVRLLAAAHENVADWPLAPEDWRRWPAHELKNSCGCYSQLWMVNKHSNIKLDASKKAYHFFNPRPYFFNPRPYGSHLKTLCSKICLIFPSQLVILWSLVFPHGVYHALKEVTREPSFREHKMKRTD